MSTMVGLAEYAEQAGKSLRTVQRWLADGRLPDARQDAEGRWWVPADAPVEPVRRRTTSPAVAVSAEAAENRAKLPAPAPLGLMGTLEDAAAALGTTVGGVRRLGRDGHLVIGPYGPHGALRVYLPPR